MLTPNIPRPGESKDEQKKRLLSGRQDNESELEYQARLAKTRDQQRADQNRQDEENRKTEERKVEEKRKLDK